MTSVDQVEEGPWLDEDGFWLIEPNRLLAETKSATLMGRAPELLVALKAAREALHQHYVDWDGEPEDAVPLQLARSRCDAAISRATGAA